ncbi:MAG TPA: hypothetical protein VFH78_15530, partial [Candidatus Thermoplasmatota archaeon]|nr:hypothetical protein [Candidatus Thermoplasmatota archaeon]
LPAGRVPRGIQLDADHVLIAGGPAKDESCNGRRAYVGRAASDGSIAEWSRAPDLPNVGDGLPIFAARPRGTTVDVYYEEGGALGCSGYPSNRIWRATYSAGALGGWTLAAHQPAPTKGGAAMVVVGDWLYFLGGGACCPGGPLAHVHRAPIAADGSLGAWIVDAPLPKPAVHANALVFDGGILVLGAHGPDITRNPEVWWSPLRADGSLDGWRTIGRVPPFLMSDGVAFEAAGRVFAGDFDREPTAASSVGVASAPSALLRAWIAASL